MRGARSHVRFTPDNNRESGFPNDMVSSPFAVRENYLLACYDPLSKKNPALSAGYWQFKCRGVDI